VGAVPCRERVRHRVQIFAAGATIRNKSGWGVSESQKERNCRLRDKQIGQPSFRLGVGRPARRKSDPKDLPGALPNGWAPITSGTGA